MATRPSNDELSFAERVQREKNKLVANRQRQLAAKNKARKVAEATKQRQLAARNRARKTAEAAKKKKAADHLKALSLLKGHLRGYGGNHWIRVSEHRDGFRETTRLEVVVGEPDRHQDIPSPVHRSEFHCSAPSRAHDIGIRFRTGRPFDTIVSLREFLDGKFSNTLARAVAKVSLQREESKRKQESVVGTRREQRSDAKARPASPLPGNRHCQKCQGYGLISSDLCPFCHGYGEVSGDFESPVLALGEGRLEDSLRRSDLAPGDCYLCAGAGLILEARCEFCAGTGKRTAHVISARHAQRVLKAALAGQIGYDAMANFAYSGGAKHLTGAEMSLLYKAMAKAGPVALDENNLVIAASTDGQE